MKVLITGGTGMIGTLLTKKLVDAGEQVVILTRNAAAEKKVHPSINFSEWDPGLSKIDPDVLQDVDHIVHLAGAGVADKRWTENRKKEILGSRVKGGELLISALRDQSNQVRSLVSASAIGFYGPGGGTGASAGFSENDKPYNDFLATTCQAWEATVAPASSLGKRLVIFRAGIVLSPRGGALEEFRKPLRFGIVPILGSGRQVISWIHVSDLLELYLLAMKREDLTGIYNAVSPAPVTNREFMRTLKRVENKKGLAIRVPSALLKIVLGEMSVEVLKSAKVSSEKIAATGFNFRFPELGKALADLVANDQR